MNFRNKKALERFSSLISFLLLIFYLGGNGSFDIFHLHSHQPAITHSDADEFDPCHRSIYHHDAENGCGHASHLVENKKCAFCDIIFHRDEICTSVGYISPPVINKEKSYFTHVGEAYFYRISLPSRAPPAV